MQKEKNTGALLIVAPNEREVRIEVGYGFEGTLTDAVSKLIIENHHSASSGPTISPAASVRGVDDIIQAVSDYVKVHPATAQSPLDWVPPPEAAQWAPGTTENLAMVRRLRPGLKGRELEIAQRAVAIQMAMLTALVGRAEASIVERRWEHRLNAMYDSRYVDQTLNRWGINPPFIERLVRDGKTPSALNIILGFIALREKLEDEMVPPAPAPIVTPAGSSPRGLSPFERRCFSIC